MTPAPSSRRRQDRGHDRHHDHRSASPRWGMVAVCSLVGLCLVAVALADRLAAADPHLALRLMPWHSAARTGQANARLQEDTPNTAAAITDIQAALRLDPLVPSAFSVLAQAHEATGDEQAAFAAWEAAARVALRDSVAQAVLLERDLQSRRIESGLARLDLLMRADPQTGLAVLQKLAGMLDEPAFRQALTDRLQDDPPWRASALRGLTARGAALDPIMAVHQQLLRGPSPPTEDEIRPLLGRLMDEGRYEEARLFWLESGPRDQRGRDEFLYNARFQAPVSNLPFDWTLEPTAGADVQIKRAGARRVLSVDFFGSRLGFQNVSQWLLLPPGDYVFSGLEQADGIVSDRGVRWRIACANNLSGELATTPALMGTIGWREFAAAFSVSSGCRVQRLVLEVPARVVLERVISGRVAYANLSLRAQPKGKP